MTGTKGKPAEGIGSIQPAGTDEQAQTAITHRYDRLARLYDLYTEPMEWAGLGGRRRRLLARASGNTLEVGIGTGRSLEYYPPGIRLVGIDVAPRMLQRAARRAGRRGMDVRLQQADVQQLPFPSRSFDTVVATCVFCSVADPVRGLAELDRVVRADGKVLLLEHVRPRGRVLGWLTDRISPLTRRLLGFSLNRRTEQNVTAAGLETVLLRRGGIWREIQARPGHSGPVAGDPRE
jgi:ubiquinone/menaquinone biosynthesis C-methylase UbiE